MLVSFQSRAHAHRLAELRWLGNRRRHQQRLERKRFLPSSCPPCSASLRRLMVFVVCWHTCDRLQLLLCSHHSLDSSARDGGDGCQHDGVERRWDEWHKSWPGRAERNGASPRSTFYANIFTSLSSLCWYQLAQQGGRTAHPGCNIRGISLECNFLSPSPTFSRGISFPSTTPSRSKNRLNRTRACTGLTRALLCCPEPEPARVGLRTLTPFLVRSQALLGLSPASQCLALS